MIISPTCWGPPPRDHALPEGEVHVWRAATNQSARAFARLNGILSADERARAARFHFEPDRRRFVVGRGTLRLLLGRYLGIPPQELRFEHDAHAKPRLAQADARLQFNVSHSGGWALVAVTRGRAVGVDIEKIRRDIDMSGIAARFFSLNERKALDEIAARMRPAAFFSCWTRKEAYLKARGDGLSMALDQFDVSLRPGELARLLETRHDPREANRWSLRALNAGRGYKAALVVEGSDWELKCWQWRPE